MDYDTAMDIETLVSLRAAIRECRRHGITAHQTGGKLIDADSGETIAESVNGEYRSADVLGWLGY